MSTPRYSFGTVPTNTTNPSVPVNDFMRLVDALLDTVVENMSLTAPPATTGADVGKVWIPAATASGAWATHEDELALCVGADAWLFIAPPAGKRVRNLDDSTDYGYSGSAWAASGSGGLTNFTEGANSSSPNATVPVVYLTATNAATNVDVAIVPKGTGAFSLGVADGTSTGGNKRGAGSVDLQLTRNAATQVASGQYSFVAGYRNKASGNYSGALGSGCTASGTNSFATGATCTSSGSGAFSGGSSNNAAASYATAFGTTNTASGEGSFAIGGFANSVNGKYSAAMGNAAHANGMYGVFIQSSGIFSSNKGDAQRMTGAGRVATTNATPATITFDGASVSTANQLTLHDYSAVRIRAQVVGYDRTNSAAVAFDADFLIRRQNGAASTTLVGSPTITQVYSDASLASCALGVSADTTRGAAQFTVTGIASTSIRWVLSIYDAVQVRG